jgi:hypothetical protein
MVYSRFLWGGLVPLALALEHEGFGRFEAAPMLRSRRGGGGGDTNTPYTYTYAIISGDRDIKSDDARVIAAIRSHANREGRVLKAVLVSDRGSEGLDLKYVREVHVLEPWYHLNKIEQVVGRASRFCSHADLPMSQRNLTVYLHAATRPSDWADSAIETIDLRAYRIAQLKQARIDRVEAILREIAIDCPLRLGNSSGTGGEDHGVTMTSSQGVEVSRRQKKQDRASTSTITTCEGSLLATTAGMDETTYDPVRHAFHGATYRRLLSSFFASRSSVSATFEDLWRFVLDGYDMGGLPNRDRVIAELTSMIESRTKVYGPRAGRPGTIVHRGARYVFQPDDEDTTALTEWERGTARRFQPIVMDARQMFISPPPIFSSDAYASASASASESESASATNAASAASSADAKRPGRHLLSSSGSSSSVTAELDTLADEVSAMLSRQRANHAYYLNAALDAVVDRLSHARLVSLSRACFASTEQLTKRQRSLMSKALGSLRSAGVLRKSSSGSSAVHEFRSPYHPGIVESIDGNTGEPVESGKGASNEAYVQEPALPPGVIGAIVANPGAIDYRYKMDFVGEVQADHVTFPS